MATLTSDKVASGVMYRQPNCPTCVYETYTLTTAVSAGDVIQMVKIPSGATILDVMIACDDLDTHGTPTLEITVGDGGDVDRFITQSNIPETGKHEQLNAVDGLGYTYTSDDTIDVRVAVSPSTQAASGDIKLAVLYTIEQ